MKIDINKLEYRKYTDDDFDDLYLLETKCFPPGVAYPRDLLKSSFKGAEGRVWVVLYNELVIGYYWSEIWDIPITDDFRTYLKTCEHDPHGNVLFIANIAVDPEYRGNSIGREMMLKMLPEMADNRNLLYSLLAVSVKNKKAHSIYSELGYVSIQRINNYYKPINSDPEAALIMIKSEVD